MTERKPDDISWDSWIERQIRDGQRNGAFDRLAGHGRPIAGIGTVHDELWWAKSKMRDEDVDLLPPTITIRAERAAAIEVAMSAPSEARVRAVLADVNARIRYVNAYATAGPPSTTMTIDVEEFVQRWRAQSRPGPPPAAPVTVSVVGTRTRRWQWRWLAAITRVRRTGGRRRRRGRGR